MKNPFSRTDSLEAEVLRDLLAFARTVNDHRERARVHPFSLVAVDVSPLYLKSVRFEPTHVGCYKARRHERVRVHRANLREFLASLNLAGES